MITLILIILLSYRIYYNPNSLFEKYNNHVNQKYELENVKIEYNLDTSAE